MPSRTLRDTSVRFALVLALVAIRPTVADEGMWTLHGFPTAAVEDALGVEIGPEWLDRVQRATVRLDGGCTGSFASAEGLVLTNNHCVWGCVRNLSSAARNLSETGFLAASRGEELQCPGFRISVLQETEEITDAIRQTTAGKSDREAHEARRAALARLESECEAASELACESVDLYHGGEVHLYKYKRYDDVRLVFAPELAVAAFGGDPDNFNFPRWCLDMSFLRVYENGRPATTPDFLPWDADGPVAGQPVFVSGHPGSTQRLLSVAELDSKRRDDLPLRLLLTAELRGRLAEWGKTSDEAARQVQQRMLGLENSLKVNRHRLDSLLDAEQMAAKVLAEEELRQAVLADPELSEAYGTAWDDAARAIRTYRTFDERYEMIESAYGFQGELFSWASTLVRAAAERDKPSEERLREYRETALPRMEQRLLAPLPTDPGYERLMLAFSLEKLRELLGPDDPVVREVLGDASPEALAARLVGDTRLADPEVRRALWRGGAEAIAASEDPMIAFARKVEPFARELRARYDGEVEAPLEQASERIARARFAVLGTSVYPDATFTLRVTYGTVRGWEERGEEVAPFTHLSRLFERATGDDPFRLPESWLAARERLDGATRYNFVADTDIIGGNSGSPVIDADGRLVGLAFDGNIHSIAGAYWFDAAKNRTVAVHPAAMLEALRVVYRADGLVEELTLEEDSAASASTVTPTAEGDRARDAR